MVVKCVWMGWLKLFGIQGRRKRILPLPVTHTVPHRAVSVGSTLACFGLERVVIQACCKGGSGVCGFTCIHSALQTVCPSGLEGHAEVEGSETRILPQSFHTKLTFTRHPHSPASGYFCKILLDRSVSDGSRAAVKEDRA